MEKVLRFGRNLPLLYAFGIWIFIAFLAYHYSFWRHDTWGYYHDPFVEFKENGRWLYPLGYDLLHRVSHFSAWLGASISLYIFVFFSVRRILKGSSHSIYIALIAPFLLLLNPSLLGQLNWPKISFSASLVLMVFSFPVLERFEKTKCLIATPIVFGISQSLSPLTLLLVFPKVYFMKELDLRKKILRFFSAFCVWGISLGSGVFLSKYLQIREFGVIPEVSEWRNPRPANTFDQLIQNFERNMLLLFEHTSLSIGFFPLASAALVMFIYMIISKKRNVSLMRIEVVGALLASVGVSVAVYIGTSVIGTDLPNRVALGVGAASVFLWLGFNILVVTPFDMTQQRAWQQIFFLVLVSQASVVSASNAYWMYKFTNDVTKTITELGVPGFLVGKTVVVDARSRNEGSVWYADHENFLVFGERYFEAFSWTFRLTPAFRELGSGGVIWCTNNRWHRLCEEVHEMHYPTCSSRHPAICANTSANGITYFRFK